MHSKFIVIIYSIKKLAYKLSQMLFEYYLPNSYIYPINIPSLKINKNART